MQGESLLSFMTSDQNGSADQRNDSNLQRPVYAESDYGHLSFGWSTLRAWRTEKYLYIEAPERELYDQSVDPLAAHNLAPDSKAVADTAGAQVIEFYRKTKGAAAEKTRLSPEQNESLHALGYLSSDSGTANEADNEGDRTPKIELASPIFSMRRWWIWRASSMGRPCQSWSRY